MQSTRGQGSGRGGRGRGRGGVFNKTRLPTDISCDFPGCQAFARDQNGLNLHKAAKHGLQLMTKDGTVSNYTATVNNQVPNPPGQGRRSIARARGRGGFQQQVGREPAWVGSYDRQYGQNAVASSSNAQYVPAPNLWVARSSQQNVSYDGRMPTREQLLSGRETHLVDRTPFTLGNGAGNKVNVVTAAHWQGLALNGTTVTVPYPIAEFIGLSISVHGDFGTHGDFALVYYSVPNGLPGISGSNVQTGTTSSDQRKALLNLRWAGNVTRHTIITGSGEFFVPCERGGAIQGAAHVNVISGTSVLGANAVLVTVIMRAVYAVTGERT